MKDQLTIKPIQEVDGESYSDVTREYFAHFGLDPDIPGCTHDFGSFQSGDFTLAGHLYRPAQYQATVVLFHGYLNHSGQFRHLIPFLIESGYAVAVFDLPGHGLSSGEAAVIKSFDQYVTATQDFLSVIGDKLHGPYHGLGFSTGAAILIDMLLNGGADCFEKIILAGPLIHWAMYEQSKGTYRMYIQVTDKITRFHRKNSSDRNYLIFNKTKDYLHASHLSLHWVKALFDWNDKIETLDSSDREVLVIQGDKDSTVEWEYNLNLIRKKFPNAKIEMIHKGRHELFNEADKYKQQALKHVADYLK